MAAFMPVVSTLNVLSRCPVQDGVHLPEDAVLGSGRGPFSSSDLCQAVPGALPYAPQQYTSPVTQVRRRDERSKAGTMSRICVTIKFVSPLCEREKWFYFIYKSHLSLWIWPLE